MKIMVGYLLLVLSFVYVIDYANASTVKRTGTFSSINFNKESGDLVGVELRIITTRTGYVGMLQICEGGAGNLIVVHPKFVGNKIHFDVNKDIYNGSFDGVININGIHGRFIFSGNRGEMEFFPRKKSYWD